MSNCIITVLGSGSEAEVPERGCDCPQCKDVRASRWPRSSPALHLIHDDLTLLFDCGPDIKEQLQRPKIKDPDAVFVTHAHPDHIDGIDDLPQTTRRFLKEGARLDHMTIEPFPVHHSTIAPAVGYVIRTDHLKIIYCPDFLEILEPDLLKGANIAFFDGSAIKRDIVRDEERTIGHMAMFNSLALAKKLKIKRVCYMHFGHIKIAYDNLVKMLQSEAGNEIEVFVSFDGMKVDVKDGLDFYIQHPSETKREDISAEVDEARKRLKSILAGL